MSRSVWGRWAVLATAGVVVLGGMGCSRPPVKTDIKSLPQRKPVTFNPPLPTGVSLDSLNDQTYPAFYRFHERGTPTPTLELALGAREPMRDTVWVLVNDKDGRRRRIQAERYTFTLRPDLRFPDDTCFRGGKGRPVTARDIVYSFKRIADPLVRCPLAASLAEKVVGWEEYTHGFETQIPGTHDLNYEQEIAGIQVDPHDPLTFQITLMEPCPELRYVMATRFTTPQAREAVEKYGADRTQHPVGIAARWPGAPVRRRRVPLTPQPAQT